ncbi:putative RNA-binding protein 15, partial [Paragonimus heterotremus]
YYEDARKAFHAKPTVYLHDRSVTVDILPETSSEEDLRKTSKGIRGGRPRDLEEKTDIAFDRRRVAPGKLETSFAELLAKSAVVAPCGTSSLLGMPGINSTAMMAAAARALGLAGPPGTLPPAIPALIPAGGHGRSILVGNRRFEHAHGGRSPPLSDSDQDLKATRTLFVGSLEPDITESEVLQAFERFGNIEQIDIKRASKLGAHSYAFVRFENVDMAYRAKSTMSGRRLRSIHCKIGFGKPIPSQCLYISGLGPSMSTEAFHQLLSRFGQVTQLDWPPDRAYAQVMFDSCEAACNANNNLKGFAIGDRKGSRLRVDYISPDIMRFGRTTGGSLANASLEANSGMESSSAANYRNSGLTTTWEPSPSSVDATISDKTNHSVSVAQFRPTNESTSRYPNRSVASEDQHFFNRQSGRRHGFNRSANRTQSTHNLLSPIDFVPPTLQNVVSLKELDQCLQPDIWKGKILLKTNKFFFRCLHVIGDAEVSSQLGKASNISPGEDETSNPTLRVTRRGPLDPSWMAEATHRIHGVLSNHHRELCLMLLLPDLDYDDFEVEREMTDKKSDDIICKPYPLNILVAYFKLKQAVGIIVPVKPPGKTNPDEQPNGNSKDSNSSLSVHLFAPSSFALSLLKQAAPRLTSELATVDNYMILLAIKR